jgi:D-alanyl-D-alanine dipeptidase
LKTGTLYILGFLFFLSSCNISEHNDTHTLRKRVVYAVSNEKHEPLPEKINSDTSYMEYVFQPYGLVNIKTLDSSIQVDLRYAGTNNFLKYNLYDGLRNAYFNCETALRVGAAQHFLKQHNPNLSLLVLDAARPQHIQQMMWDSLKMHPDKKQFYLSNPEETSMHNYGCAADVTIINTQTNELLDMGTDYDFFGKLSQPIYEKNFLKTGELSAEAYQNRLLLRTVMQRARMNPITSEWWHFSMCSKKEAAEKFQLIK